MTSTAPFFQPRLQYFRALSIAGFDGSGGAGILADVKTFSALGCYGMSVITALTAQNTQGVSEVLPVEPYFVRKQLELIVKDLGVDAIKLGMLHRQVVMEALVDPLKELSDFPLVLDPVMVAKGGHSLLDPDSITTLKNKILPLATVVTPNCYEAEILAGMSICSAEEQIRAAHRIGELGPKLVIIKGGHVEEGKKYSKDYVFIQGEEGFWLEGRRIDTQNTHGTGCTFSAAITAYLAKGFSPRKAISMAKLYIQEAIEYGARFDLGQGNGPVCHFFDFLTKK